MRHKLKGRKLGRTSSHRKAMLINMACSLIQYEQIKTTLPKAKELRPYIEKLVTKAKHGISNGDKALEIRNKRLLMSKLRNNSIAVSKLFNVLAVRYKTRPGGYIRVIKANFRHGDAAPIAYIQFVDREVEKTIS
jgi:large subunit ribosomal protein L17